MPVRTPRFKTEFITQQKFTINGEQHVLVSNRDAIDLVADMIRQYLKDTSRNPQVGIEYCFGVVDATGQLEGIAHPVIDKYAEAAWSVFSFKYLEQEFLPKRQEDYVFLYKLILAAGYVNPRLREAKLAEAIHTNTPITAKQVFYTLKSVLYQFERQPEVQEQLDRHPLYQVRLNPHDKVIDLNYNLYTGGVDYSYVNMTKFNHEYYYHFLYLYFYRLYDLAVNQHQQLNTSIIINDLNELLHPRNFRSFYATEQEQYDRRKKLVYLLNELFAVSNEAKLNFIILGGISAETGIELYGEKVDTEVAALIFKPVYAPQH